MNENTKKDYKKIDYKMKIAVSNTFNINTFNISATSLDMLFLLVSQLDALENNTYTYSTSLKDLEHMYKRFTKDQLIKSAEELTTKVLNLKYKNEDNEVAEISTTLFDTFTYTKGKIEFKLNSKIIPVFGVNKDKGSFTDFSFLEFIELRTQQEKRLYILFSQFKKRGMFTAYTSFLKKILNFEEKYDDYSQFKAKILKKAVIKIIKITSLSIKIKEKKTSSKDQYQLHFEVKDTKVVKVKSNFDNLNEWMIKDNEEIIDVEIVDKKVATKTKEVKIEKVEEDEKVNIEVSDCIQDWILNS